MLNVSQWSHWPRFKTLMLMMFGLWLTFFFVIHTFVTTLNKIVVPVLELPLGFYLPVQAAIVVFVVTLVWFARATRR